MVCCLFPFCTFFLRFRFSFSGEKGGVGERERHVFLVHSKGDYFPCSEKEVIVTLGGGWD